MSAHAQLSPSSAVRWMACPGSVQLCAGKVDTSSSFADEGTDAHELAALCLETNTDADAYLGRVMEKGNAVNAEMVLAVQDYLNYVRTVVAAVNGTLLVEQRLPISGITGEPDAKGTSDVVILSADELIVIDLKYGRGVPVQADHNPQLQIYGLAALHEFSLVQDFKTVRMAIHQPRLGAVSEWAQTVEELEEFGADVLLAAQMTAAQDAALYPTDKGCKFCKAKADCPALVAKVQEAVGADFDDLTTWDRDTTKRALTDHQTTPDDKLASSMQVLDLIEGWIKAVRAEVESRLLAGVSVAGYKLVQGKKGNRAWSSPEEAEKQLKAMRLKVEEMYELSLISPTAAEKLAPKFDKTGKPVPPKEGAPAPLIGPRQWPKLKALITQSDGRPSVAPETDPRPALVMSAVASDFDDVTATGEDLA